MNCTCESLSGRPHECHPYHPQGLEGLGESASLLHFRCLLKLHLHDGLQGRSAHHPQAPS